MSTKATIVRRVEESPAETGQWQTVQVFYSANPRPLLTECVTPLVRELREAGLLDGYYFVSHWLEGAHVRLCLRPRTMIATGPVLDRAESALDNFLARRPAMRTQGYQTLLGVYSHQFDAEYTETERLAMYPDGRMPIQVDNTVHLRRYDPERARYGGDVGVGLMEWHLQQVSELVLELLAADRGPALAQELMSATVATLCGGGAVTRSAPTVSLWADHCASLRHRVIEAERAEALTQPARNLLSRLAHTTNDQIGLLVR